MSINIEGPTNIEEPKSTNRWGITTHQAVPVEVRDELVSLLVYEAVRSIAEPIGIKENEQYNPVLISAGYYELLAAVSEFGLVGATRLPSTTAMEPEVLGALIINTMYPHGVDAIPRVDIGEITCQNLKASYQHAYAGIRETSALVQDYVKQFKIALGASQPHRETEATSAAPISAPSASDAVEAFAGSPVSEGVDRFNRDSAARREAIIAHHAMLAEQAKIDLAEALAAVTAAVEEPVVVPAPMVMPTPPSIREADEGWDMGDIALGILGVAAAGAAVYYGHKYLAGDSLDDVVLLDLDTTL